MSSIQNQPAAAGLVPVQTALPDAQFSSYVRKQSFTASESLDAGVTIKTKEGDLVTLTSNTYAEMDAFMYDSKGVVQTESGTAVMTQNQREITLTSGDSFSFSVEGELSEEELADIEAIVKGIDEIVSEMARGDMDDALETALSMGGYDTVSMYSADITYQKSYAMRSETHAETVKALPGEEMLPAEDAPVTSGDEKRAENPGYRSRGHKRGKNVFHNMSRFVERMAERLEKHESQLVEKAQKPIDKLFRHHMIAVKGNNGEETPIYNTIENARKQIEELMDKMAGDIFKENLSAFFE